MLPRLVLTFALVALASPLAAFAQTPQPAPQPAVQTQQYDTPAYVSVVDGSATLERDGKIENAPLNMPLLSGDRLRTTEGRVEVRFADGGRLHLDARSSLDVLSDELVRLGDGRIRLAVQRAPQVSYRVDSAVGSVRITQPGEYRIAIIRNDSETQIELAVVRGGAEIFTEQGSTPVRSGERAYASAGLMPSYAYSYNSANMDEFDRWSEMQRGTVYAATSESSQYLPADMTSYASTFDQYGDWRYQQAYGYVWYPRVSVGWRPYYYGRWSPYPSYGWTWIAGDPFGYPTHHYGRWGISAGVWFWIPRPYWGPAYVSWGYAPNYVSWCPLGWNNAAVFSIGYYNVGAAYYAGHYRGHYYSAWTTVPHGYFGRGYYAHQHAVNWDRPGYTGARPRFTEAGAGPTTSTFAVARGTTTPVRYAGTRTVIGSGARTPADGGFQRLPSASDRARGGAFDQAQVRGGDQAQARTRGPGQTETPRFINRGDQIVRSQTERPSPPRTAPQSTQESIAGRRTDAPFTRAGRAGDDPAYRPMPSNGDAYRGSYDRAVPRTQDAMPIDRQAPQRTTPGNETGAGGARGYTRPYPGDTVYGRPYGGDRVYSNPSTGDRAFERPAVGDRAFERPSAGRVESAPPMQRVAPSAPPSAMRPIERPAPSAPPPAARPTERAAPAQPSAPPPRSGGGDRAVPRSGGSPSGHRGGGQSR